MVLSPPQCSTFLKQPGYQHLWKVLPTKAPDYPYSVSLSGLCTRSLVSCAQCLCSSTAGLSTDGFTLNLLRRNRLDQKLVEKLVHTQTNLVMRESLDDTLRHLLPWDIDLVIDESVDEDEEEPEV